MAYPDSQADDLALESARVVAVEADGVWLETGLQRGCANCREGRGCGVSIFQRLFRLPRHRVFLPTDEPLSVGDHVVIGLAQRALLVASLWLYLAPLAGLLLSALVIDLAFASEWLTVIGGLAGLGGMLLVVRRRQDRQARSGQFFPILHEVTLREASDAER